MPSRPSQDSNPIEPHPRAKLPLAPSADDILPAASMPDIGAQRAGRAEMLREIEAVAKNIFGHESLRPGQAEVILAALEHRDVLATFPTSFGKSLCFQIPGIMAKEGVQVVVSPLIALQADQVKNLRAKGIAATYLNSRLTESEYQEELGKVAMGQVKFLYISPEGLHSEKVIKALKAVGVNGIAVDEAHCTSMWGHDFRPTYTQIASIRAVLGHPPIWAYTATAPVRVRDDIRDILKLENQFEYHADIDRPNLDFKIERFTNSRAKTARLWELIDEAVAAGKGPVIVYCARVRTVEELHEKAKARGLAHAYYHGDLDRDARIEAEAQFLGDKVPVIFSTKAFGMGVHKSNVRRVINFEMTDSLEEYYQEAGRGGRDGDPADCILLYQPHDVYLQRAFVNGANPSLDFIKWVYHQRWKYVPRERRDDDVPETQFNMRWLLSGWEDESHFMRQKIVAAFAQLVEYGVLEVTPGTLRFLLKPDQVKGGEFPITEQMIETKRAYDFQRLQIMLYYATSNKDPRQTMLGHFNNNSIVDEIGASKIEDQAILDPEHVKQILRAVFSKDYDRRHLPSILSGKRGADLDASMRLADLTNFESKLEVEYAASRGLIRMVKVGRKTFVTITPDGLDALEADGVTIEPIETYDKLRPVMLSPAGRFMLCAALRKWVDLEKAGNANPRDQFKERIAWWTSIEEFKKEKFQVLDKKITGLQLVAHFMRIPRARVQKPDIKSFLNFLFENRIP